MKRVVVAVLMALLLAPNMSMAQDPSPTAIVVAPPTSDGCDRIGDYVADLQAVADSMRIRWEALFPSTPQLDQMTDDDANVFLFSMTPAELQEFAAFFDEGVVQLEAIDVPQVAQPFHQENILGARLVANWIREAATSGFLMAGIIYSDMVEASDAKKDALGQAALSVCPAFQEVLDFYADDTTPPTSEPMTPETAHRLDGTIALVGDDSSEPRTPTFQQPSGRCQGAGRYGDIQPNTIVTLSDSDGQLLGYGTLGEGWYVRSEGGDMRCTFTFFISQVPVRDEYTIEFGSESFTYNYHDLELVDWSVSFALGFENS